ncbi:MAG TPA: ATP-binding cassette domain-containing protein [Ralstonia sp.]|nr:ATP-binding cassette domain-containing protein [Ralstonia sp.]HWV03703.1 ATP-binding cassette domain-containing protein [Ralstonia sp.]
MIILKNVILRRSAKVLLDGASVVLNPGEKVGLVGRNGAGKSTLFALLNGTLHEDGGDFSIPKQWRLAQVAQNMPETDESATDFVVAGDTRLPVARLERGTPALRAEDDVYTNHIHADDLARAVIAALFRGKPQRVVHASDASELRMGDYFDAVADARGLQRPPRISRAEAVQQIEPALLSFMSESRRLRNTRLARELRVALRYPTVADFLSSEA